MFKWFNKRRNLNQQVDKLYAATALQARNTAFFGPSRVPDTLEGRYEMIVLHVFLLMERLQGSEVETAQTARLLAERFVTDMDDCMRELGIGDTSVPKKVKRAAAGLLERCNDYRTAISAGPNEMSAALAAHVFDGSTDQHQISTTRKLADYARASAVMLSKQPIDELTASQPAFANPADFLN